MSLDQIISRLRKVKYGDYVMAEDHNDLVEAIKLMRGGVITGSRECIFRADNVHSSYNKAPEESYAIYESIFSRKIGDCDISHLYWIAMLDTLLRVSVYGQYSETLVVLHTSDHPVGETIEGVNVDPTRLDDAIDSLHVATNHVEATWERDYWYGILSLPTSEIPCPIYVVIWHGSYAIYKDSAFTAYLDKIRLYSEIKGIWL